MSMEWNENEINFFILNKKEILKGNGFLKNTIIFRNEYFRN